MSDGSVTLIATASAAERDARERWEADPVAALRLVADNLNEEWCATGLFWLARDELIVRSAIGRLSES